MGSLIAGATSLFGPSASKATQQSTSSNQGFDFLKNAFSGVVGQGGQASSALANMLGLGGEPAQTGAFDNWRKNTGYDFGFKQGQQGVVGSQAAKGLLNSGSTARALTQFGQDYGNSKYNDYMTQLSGLLGQGLQAGNVIGGAGNVSQSTSKSVGAGANGGVGQVFKGVAGKLLGK